jgi:hypothetical protein
MRRYLLFALAQLRHLYTMMMAGQVRDARAAARGLLGPAIERIEAEYTPYLDVRESLRDTPGAPRVGMALLALGLVDRAASGDFTVGRLCPLHRAVASRALAGIVVGELGAPVLDLTRGGVA